MNADDPSLHHNLELLDTKRTDDTFETIGSGVPQRAQWRTKVENPQGYQRKSAEQFAITLTWGLRSGDPPHSDPA
jgi:hypothetical protein